MEKKNPTSVVSFSCTLEVQNWLADYCIEKGMTRSQAIRYLIRMGMTYLQVLDTQMIASGAMSGENEKLESVSDAEKA